MKLIAYFFLRIVSIENFVQAWFWATGIHIRFKSRDDERLIGPVDTPQVENG